MAIDRRLRVKFEKLRQIVLKMRSVLVAYSGGVDSSLVLKVCSDVLRDSVLAVIARSATYPESEFRAAKSFVNRYGIKFRVIKTKELTNPKFYNNPENRCYYCKNELFSMLSRIAREYNLKHIADGSNYDDRLDYRPGTKAAKKYEVRSPLKEAGLTKKEIRKISREMNLSTWDKPSLACLSSRFPYHSRIKDKDLRRINKAEDLLREMGFSQVRVRHHNTLARIEVLKEEIPKFLKTDNAKLINRFRKLGYNYITVDLEGYRCGSMNERIGHR